MAEITTLYANQYGDMLQLLLQQRGSKLRDKCSIGMSMGAEGAVPVEQAGAIEATERTGRFQTLSPVESEYLRPWVFPSTFDATQWFDNFEKLRMSVDPKSKAVEKATYALGRKIDDIIITAFFATRNVGKTGSETVAFPSADQVAADEGAASATGLTVAKLEKALELLMAHEVDLDAETPCVAITAKQHANLLKEVQVTSKEYNNAAVMVDGKIRHFLGFDFVHVERLKTDGTYRRIPVWVKSGIHLNIWQDIKSDVSQIKHLSSQPWQIYSSGVFGATRLEEGRVIEIKCVA